MEAFEHIVKVFLEHEGYLVTGGIKFAVRKKTRKVKKEYQTHGYEVDIVAARADSLILGSVKSYLGSMGVNRQGFAGIADRSKNTHFARYIIFNDKYVRNKIIKLATARFGYRGSQIHLALYVGKFKSGDERVVRDHLGKMVVGAGRIKVVGVKEIIQGILQAADSKTYTNDPVVMTVKCLKYAGLMSGQGQRNRTAADLKMD